MLIKQHAVKSRAGLKKEVQFGVSHVCYNWCRGGSADNCQSTNPQVQRVAVSLNTCVITEV